MDNINPFWNEEHFRLVVENSNDLISASDEKGDFLYVSPSHKRILGYNPNELVGKNSFDLVHPRDRKRTFAEFQKGLDGERGSLVEFSALHKNGKEVKLEATAATAVVIRGKPVFIAIMRDISQRRELERKKEEFINVAHHELKTPLTSINASAQLLQRNRESQHHSQRVQENIERLNSKVSHLTDLVDKLVIYSEIQLGKVKIKKSYVFIDSLINGVVSEFEDSGRTIIVENPLNKRVFVDKKLISNALYQVVENALKFSAKDLSVIIRTVERDEFIKISVEDFGKGIAKAEKKRLGKNFYQSGTPLAYLNPGFGLGLYIASELLKLHGGELEIISKPKGSIFNLCLPKQQLSQLNGTLNQSNLNI